MTTTITSGKIYITEDTVIDNDSDGFYETIPDTSGKVTVIMNVIHDSEKITNNKSFIERPVSPGNKSSKESQTQVIDLKRTNNEFTFTCFMETDSLGTTATKRAKLRYLTGLGSYAGKTRAGAITIIYSSENEQIALVNEAQITSISFDSRNSFLIYNNQRYTVYDCKITVRRGTDR